MDCRAIPPQQLPHTSKLFRDFNENFSAVKEFFAHRPELKSVASCAKALDFPRDRRLTVAGILRDQNLRYGHGAETEANLKRLEEGAVAVVSGQQVGLFGGPAFSIYKALSVIETARHLNDEGIPAVPVFWMAAEDHDVNEVRHTTWFADGKLYRLELPKPAEDAIPVGTIPLGGTVVELVEQAIAQLAGPAAAQIAEILHRSYTRLDTYTSAFGKLFARLFGEHGLILLDPLDHRLHRVAAPILRAALAERDTLNELLLRRGKKLENAGYDEQVKVTSRSTLLFSMKGGKRQVITAANGNFSCGGKSCAREEALRCVESDPENFSPNALFRPVVQDYLLPTVAYFGGPAEISYYAQSQVLYEKLLGRMPVILPRADFTLVDPKGERLLKKYGLDVEDAWKGKQELRKKMYGANVPKKLAREFDTNLRQLEKNLKKLHRAIAKVDPTVQGTITRVEKRMRYQLERLREKTGASLDRHEKIIAQHEEFLENLLYPQKGLQSRDLCFLPFLARWGSEGLKELHKLATAKKPGQHCVVGIP
jgi:bacillithiol biosynthesis cysteine-adding enzyme BshC